jgi:hypothetical protein
MSISAMTNVAFARRTDVPPLGQAPKTDKEIVAATSGTEESRSVASQVQVIATYIPTEVITLYVAVLAALHNQKQGPDKSDWIAFTVFVICTPIIVWLSYAGKVRAADKPLPILPWKWPLWEMIAASIAFVAWAFSLPNSPFSSYSWYNAAIAGVAVLVASTGLGLLAPVVQRPLPT